MFCEFCYEQFEEKYWNQKYCCKRCATDAHMKRNRDNMCRKREIGTSDFFQHAHIDDFEREYLEISIEMKKLGFKRQFT